jgi:hypothetical protein
MSSWLLNLLMATGNTDTDHLVVRQAARLLFVLEMLVGRHCFVLFHSIGWLNNLLGNAPAVRRLHLQTPGVCLLPNIVM